MLKVGIDCIENTNALINDVCCPPVICETTVCDMVCKYMSLLPRGPLWDRAKDETIRRYLEAGPDCNAKSCLPPETGCTSLANFAAYKAIGLHELVIGGIAPAIAEDSPYTAYDTLDDWLNRLGWEDCYNSACRDPQLGLLTPYEVLGPCGPIFCAPTTPVGLSMAVKHGIALALARLRLGIIKNLCSINFVLSSLGARLDLIVCNPNDPSTVPYLGDCKNRYRLVPIASTMNPWIKPLCQADEEYSNKAKNPIAASYTPISTTGLDNGFGAASNCGNAAGLPSIIWPGVLAAECIARSLLPRDGSVELVRVC